MAGSVPRHRCGSTMPRSTVSTYLEQDLGSLIRACLYCIPSIPRLVHQWQLGWEHHVGLVEKVSPLWPVPTPVMPAFVCNDQHVAAKGCEHFPKLLTVYPRSPLPQGCAPYWLFLSVIAQLGPSAEIHFWPPSLLSVNEPSWDSPPHVFGLSLLSFCYVNALSSVVIFWPLQFWCQTESSPVHPHS